MPSNTVIIFISTIMNIITIMNIEHHHHWHHHQLSITLPERYLSNIGLWMCFDLDHHLNTHHCHDQHYREDPKFIPSSLLSSSSSSRPFQRLTRRPRVYRRSCSLSVTVGKTLPIKLLLQEIITIVIIIMIPLCFINLRLIIFTHTPSPLASKDPKFFPFFGDLCKF